MPSSVAVVVPVHNFELSPIEKLSLRQIKNQLGYLPLFVVYPHGGHPTSDLWSQFEKLEIRQIWGRYGQTAVQSYSALLRSGYFYEHFEQFDFILIAQLDTYIFSSDIQQFTSMPYDYWGAPWFMDLYTTYPYLRDLVRPSSKPSLFKKVMQRLLPQTIYRYVGNGGKQGELFAVKIFETPDFTESIQLTALGNLIGRRIHSEECKNKISAILGNPNTPGKIGINAAFVVGDQIKLASSEPEVYKPWLSLIQAKLAETQDLTTVQYILFGLGNANVKEIIPIAEKYLKHDEEAIRTAAILSLRQVEDPRAIDVAITALQREKSASAKSIMIRNIAEYNHINSVISRIDNYLDKESDPSLISRALRLLSERTPNAIGLLVKYKDHPSDLVKETVREQLGNYKF